MNKKYKYIFSIATAIFIIFSMLFTVYYVDVSIDSAKQEMNLNYNVRRIKNKKENIISIQENIIKLNKIKKEQEIVKTALFYSIIMSSISITPLIYNYVKKETIA